MTFQLISAFLQSLLQLGGTLGENLGKRADLIMSALNAGRALVEQGNAGAVDLRKLTEEIDAMVAAGVPPSREQIDAMQGRFNAAFAIADAYLKEHG